MTDVFTSINSPTSYSTSYTHNDSQIQKAVHKIEGQEPIVQVLNPDRDKIQACVFIMTAILMLYAIWLIIKYPITNIAFNRDLYESIKQQTIRTINQHQAYITYSAIGLKNIDQQNAQYNAEVCKLKELLIKAAIINR